MDYIGEGWGIGFGIWVTFIFVGLLVFYFLQENTKGDDILDKY